MRKPPPFIEYRSVAFAATAVEMSYDQAQGEFDVELRFLAPDVAALAVEGAGANPRLTLVVHGRQYDSYNTRLTENAMRSVVDQINRGNIDVHDGHISWHADKGPEHYVGRLTNARVEGDDVVADAVLLPIDGENANARSARIVKTLRGGGRLGSSMVFRTLKFIPKNFDRPWEGGEIEALELLAVDIVTGAAYKRARGSVRLNSTQCAEGQPAVTVELLRALETDEGVAPMNPDEIRALIEASVTGALGTALAPLTQRLEAVEAGLQERSDPAGPAPEPPGDVVTRALETAPNMVGVPAAEYRALIAADLELRQLKATRALSDDSAATTDSTKAAAAQQQAPGHPLDRLTPEQRAQYRNAIQAVGLTGVH